MNRKIFAVVVAGLAVAGAARCPAYYNQAMVVKAESKTIDKKSEIIKINPPEQGFFAKKINCFGVVIKAPANVDDKALIEAKRRLSEQIGKNPGIMYNLAQTGCELHIISKDEGTSSIPYLAHYKGLPYDGKLTIDERTRGVGGLCASCGEENLLKLDNDRYKGRDICRHEFAHTILEYGSDEAMKKFVMDQYKKSTGEGKWKDAYAGSNYHEYFAEMTMWYFGTQGDFGKITPKPEAGKEWLKSYDPGGYEMMDAIYSGKFKVAKIARVNIKKSPASLEALVKSGNDPKPTTIVFDNRTNREIKICWIDGDGKRQSPDTIYPGGRERYDTHVGHAWLVSEKDGKAIGVYVADKQPGRVVVK